MGHKGILSHLSVASLMQPILAIKSTIISVENVEICWRFCTEKSHIEGCENNKAWRYLGRLIFPNNWQVFTDKSALYQHLRKFWKETHQFCHYFTTYWQFFVDNFALPADKTGAAPPFSISKFKYFTFCLKQEHSFIKYLNHSSSIFHFKIQR